MARQTRLAKWQAFSERARVRYYAKKREVADYYTAPNFSHHLYAIKVDVMKSSELVWERAEDLVRMIEQQGDNSQSLKKAEPLVREIERHETYIANPIA